MRLVSFAVGDYTSYGAIDGDAIVDLGRLFGAQYPTLGAVLRGGELHRALKLGATSKATIALEEIRYLPTAESRGRMCPQPRADVATST